MSSDAGDAATAPVAAPAAPHNVVQFARSRAERRPAAGRTPGTAPTAPRASMDELRRDRDHLHMQVQLGRQEAVDRQHSLGKLTARERIDAILDVDSFLEIGMLRRGDGATGAHTDGVVAGSGTVDGRRVCLYAQDFSVSGGSVGAAHAAKIHKVMDLALATGSPLVALNDSGGARIQEGVAALDGYGGVFRRHVAASGVIPQISVVLGPCAGGAAYSPALADVVFMVRGISQMYLTGPSVVAAVTGEEVTAEQLGGADAHGEVSGVATVVHDDEDTCLADVRYLLSILPRNNVDPPPPVAASDATRDLRPRLADLVPADPAQPYDVRDVVAEVVDDGQLFELHERWAANVVCGLGHVGGRLVGVVANQPSVLAGVLDRDASQKAARFVRFCDAFNIPLVTFVDVPGFLPGTAQEHAGVIRHGAQLLYAYCEATVARIQVILRKAYGGAYIVMDSPSIGADLSLAWPTNEIAVLGGEAAVDVLHRRELAEADEPAELRARLAAEYREEYVHPWYAAERGFVDAVVDPAETRAAVAKGLDVLRDKEAEGPRRKHGNVPL